jgi:hypothetical protein
MDARKLLQQRPVVLAGSARTQLLQQVAVEVDLHRGSNANSVPSRNASFADCQQKSGTRVGPIAGAR